MVHQWRCKFLLFLLLSCTFERTFGRARSMEVGSLFSHANWTATLSTFHSGLGPKTGLGKVLTSRSLS